MSRLYLFTKDKKYPRGDWELLLGKGRVRLTDPLGVVAADFGLEEADKRFLLPSFWKSVAKLGVKIDAKQIIWFEKSSESVAEVKRYLAYALAAQGESAISTARVKGWSAVIGGTVLLLIGIGLLVLAFATAHPEGRLERWRIAGPVIAIITGGGLLGTGVTVLSRASTAETEWGGED